MLNQKKKNIGFFLFGVVLVILLVLLLPISGWLFTIGIVIIAVGIMWITC